MGVVSCRCVAVLGRGSFLLAWSCVWLPFLSVCRGAAGFGFSLSFGLVGRRKEGGAVLRGVGVYPPLGGAGFAGAAAGAARLLRRAVCFLAGWHFFVGLGFLWGSVFRLRVWLGGVSSFLVAVSRLFPFLLAWSGWLRSGAAKHRRRVRRRPRYAVGLWGVGGRRCCVVASLVGLGRCLLFLAVWGGACWVLGSFFGRLVVAAIGCVGVLCGRVPRRAILLCRHGKSGRARLLPAVGWVVKIRHLENLFAGMV